MKEEAKLPQAAPCTGLAERLGGTECIQHLQNFNQQTSWYREQLTIGINNRTSFYHSTLNSFPCPKKVILSNPFIHSSTGKITWERQRCSHLDGKPLATAWASLELKWFKSCHKSGPQHWGKQTAQTRNKNCGKTLQSSKIQMVFRAFLFGWGLFNLWIITDDDHSKPKWWLENAGKSTW